MRCIEIRKTNQPFVTPDEVRRVPLGVANVSDNPHVESVPEAGDKDTVAALVTLTNDAPTSTKRISHTLTRHLQH